MRDIQNGLYFYFGECILMCADLIRIVGKFSELVF